MSSRKTKGEASTPTTPRGRPRRNSVSAPRSTTPIAEEKAATPRVRRASSVKKSDAPLWGRYYGGDLFWTFAVGMVFFFSPPLVIYFFIACSAHDCSLARPAQLLLEGQSFQEVIWNHVPMPTLHAAKIALIWIAYNVLCYLYLPGPVGYGQETPAGHKLKYNVNGLRVFFLNHVLYFALSTDYLGIKMFEPTIIYDNWGPLLIVANIIGYALATFAYIKAIYFPTHPDDVKFSGNFVYDFFMGAEMNPRIGDFDFKLFWNGRPGIGAWNLINISFIYAQYRTYGVVTNSILLVTFLHFLYIVDFFYNEDWYLRTIDICHDHYGWYLGWGDPVWLPWMYTLQGLYLVTHPVQLPWWQFALTLGAGLLGYYIFRTANNQKDMFRKANGKMNIWGKPATFIRAPYKTVDGKVHTSLLLTSGFWGLARHFNYLGDLLISFAYCAACGFSHLLPYFYFFYMIILLTQRTSRDDQRCRVKYGKKWEEYCETVKYKIIPYVW